ncbi:MAG: hypothetical protein [Microviridae sp.]|nr:MAG: hypothetical protein [Microviridae sp.]
MRCDYSFKIFHFLAGFNFLSTHTMMCGVCVHICTRYLSNISCIKKLFIGFNSMGFSFDISRYVNSFWISFFCLFFSVRSVCAFNVSCIIWCSGMFNPFNILMCVKMVLSVGLISFITLVVGLNLNDLFNISLCMYSGFSSMKFSNSLNVFFLPVNVLKCFAF